MAEIKIGNSLIGENHPCFTIAEAGANHDGNIEKALEKVCSLNGFHYTPNSVAGDLGYDTTAKKVGVSAQEVLNVLPEAVTSAPIDLQYYTVQYDKLIPLLIEAVKELSERKCNCGV